MGSRPTHGKPVRLGYQVGVTTHPLGNGFFLSERATLTKKQRVRTKRRGNGCVTGGAAAAGGGLAVAVLARRSAGHAGGGRGGHFDYFGHQGRRRAVAGRVGRLERPRRPLGLGDGRQHGRRPVLALRRRSPNKKTSVMEHILEKKDEGGG